MAENEVSLKIGLEVAEALKRLEKFEKQAKDSAGNSQSAFDGLKGVVAGALAVFAGIKITDFFDGGIQAAEAQESAMNSVATALRQTGEYSDDALESFKSFADTMEETSKFGDDVVLSQVAIAKSFGLTNDQAKDLVKGAVELTTKGYDLDSAVKLLGKTYSGTTGKLGAQLPVLKSLTKEQLENGAAVQEVIKAYGGSAAAELNTYGGAVVQTTNAFGNFQESIGEAIVKSPFIVAGIKAVGDVFRILEQVVKDNRPAIDAFIEGIVKGIAFAVPIATGAFKGIVLGVEAFISVCGLAAQGALLIGEALTSVFGQVLEDAITGTLDGLTETIRLLGQLPGAETAFAAFGTSADELATSIDSASSSLKGLTGDSALKIQELRDKTGEWTAGFVEGAGQFNVGLDNVITKFDDLAIGVAGADTAFKVAGASGESALGQIAKGATQSAEEMKKLKDEAQKFVSSVTQSSLSELDKVQAKRDEDIAKLREYYSEHVISEKQLNETTALIRQATSDKIAELEQKDLERYKAQLKERADALRGIAQDPASFLVGKFEFSPEARRSLEDFGKENGSALAAGLGGIDKALGGKDGAKDLLASGVGAFADTMLPGVGGVVSSIFGKLADGPEATKAFIKDFIKGIPEIITNVAESMPVVVEALVDSLINEGGLIKIAMALLKAFSGEAVFKSLGKQLGVNAGDSLNAQKIGPKMGESFKKTLPDFSKMFKASFEAGVEPVKKLLKGDVQGAFKAAIDKPIEAARASLPEALRKPFDNAIAKLRELPQTFSEPFKNLGAKLLPDFRQLFSAGANQFIDPVRRLFQGDIQGALKSAILGPFEAVKQSLPAAIQAPFTRFQEALSGAFDRFIPNIGASIAAGADQFIAPVRNLFQGDVSGAIQAAITKPFEAIKTALPEALKAPFERLTGPLYTFAEKVGALVNFKFPSLPSFRFPELPKFPSLPSFPSIPTPPFIKRFEDTVNKLLGFQIPGTSGGGGKKGPTGTPLDSLIPHAAGGVIPRGYPNDTYPARLTSGERVLTVQQNRGLEDFVDRGGSDAETKALLTRILDALERPMQVQTSTQVDGREFARIMLQLSRQNARVA